jgi:hypothetical protein
LSYFTTSPPTRFSSTSPEKANTQTSVSEPAGSKPLSARYVSPIDSVNSPNWSLRAICTNSLLTRPFARAAAIALPSAASSLRYSGPSSDAEDDAPPDHPIDRRHQTRQSPAKPPGSRLALPPLRQRSQGDGSDSLPHHPRPLDQPMPRGRPAQPSRHRQFLASRRPATVFPVSEISLLQTLQAFNKFRLAQEMGSTVLRSNC